ncbi:MFS domain-containing protein [Aphelenchoides fujianensis]|nr:MFS domain-containing protein [Aphelenchoides fujianensis]
MGAESSLFHFKSYRLVVLLLLMFATYCTITYRADLGIAIVCMVAPEAENRSTLSTPPGEFHWTKSEQANLFSALFYGSLVTIGFSGTLADRFGPKMLLLGSSVLYTLLTLLTPLLVYDYYLYLVARFAMGLADGVFFPCAASLTARWFPPNERSTVASVYTSGNQIAASFGVVAASWMCKVSFMDGWKLIFYSFGAVGVVNLVLFAVFVQNTPNQSKFIRESEKIFLNVQLSSQHSGLALKKLSFKKIPWTSMLTSTAVFAVVIAQFSFNFVNTFLQSFLPSYFKDVLRLDLNENGWFSAMPFITQLIFKNVTAIAADSLKKRNILSTTASCKILQSFATFGTAIVLVVMAYFVNCNTQTLGLVLALFAGQISGGFTAALCIAPAFTGTISSLSTFVGVLGSILAPTIVGFVNKTGSIEEWRTIFLVAAGISTVSGAIFLVFGSAEVQPWAKVERPQTVVVQSASLPNLQEVERRRTHL